MRLIEIHLFGWLREYFVEIGEPFAKGGKPGGMAQSTKYEKQGQTLGEREKFVDFGPAYYLTESTYLVPAPGSWGALLRRHPRDVSHLTLCCCGWAASAAPVQPQSWPQNNTLGC